MLEKNSKQKCHYYYHLNVLSVPLIPEYFQIHKHPRVSDLMEYGQIDQAALRLQS